MRIHLKIILFLLVIVFIFLEWLAFSRTAGLLTQRRALFLSQKTEETFQLLTVSRKYDPDNGSTHLYLAKMFMARRDYPRAREETVQALKTIASMDAYQQLASIEQNMGNPTAAEELLNRVIRLYPSEENARLRLAALQIGEHHYDEASANMATLLKDHPENINAYYFLGLIHARQGKSKEARDMFNTLIQLQPALRPKLFFTIDDLYYQTALVELDMKEWDAAADNLKKALALKRYVPYINTLSFIYGKKGDFKKAEDILREGLTSFPENRDLKESLSILLKSVHSKEGERK